MKTIQYLLYALIATFVLAGCSEDIEYNPGEKDDPNTYGVYFPSQEASGDKEFDPAEPTTLTFKAMRKNTNDAITVPIVVKADADVFTFSEIQFKDGQQETKFKVDFPNAEVGKTYKCSIEVTDKKYAAHYGDKAYGLDFSVTRVQWNLVKGTDGSTTGLWRDDFFTAIMGSNIKENGVPNAEKAVQIFERADMKGYYRIYNIYDEAYMKKIVGVNFGNVPSLKSYTIIDARDPEKVWFPTQSTGWAVQDIGYDDNGAFIIVSMCEQNGLTKSVYGTLKDGVLTFPQKAIALTTPSIWIEGSLFKYNSDMTRLIFPGAKSYDYSTSFTKSAPADGKVNLGAKLGTDVAKMKYAFFEGRLSTSAAAAKSTDMDAGLVETTEITKSGTIVAQMDKTGIYTIVGNVYDAQGNLQNYASLDFGYVAVGDSKPVVMNVRTELTWEKEAEGHTPENSIKGILFGEEIVSGYMGMVTTASIQGKSEAEVISSLQNPKNAFTQAELEKINGKGYAPFYINLEKGTSYTFLVYVNNGYYNKLFAVEQTTKGKADPFSIHYIMDDITTLPTKDELYKTTWNYYAVDAYDEKDKVNRQYIGTVTFSENTKNDTQTIDYINVKGLSANLAADLDTKDDTILAQRQPNGLFTLTPTNYLGFWENKYHIFNGFTEEESTGVYDTQGGCLYGGYVGDGMIAMVPNPNFVAQGHTFAGLFFGAYDSNDISKGELLGGLNHFKYILFVDPAKDPHTKAASIVSKALALHPTDCVSLRGVKLAKAIWDEQVGKVANRGANPLEGEVSTRIATPKASSFKEGFVSQTASGLQAGGFAKMSKIKMDK